MSLAPVDAGNDDPPADAGHTLSAVLAGLAADMQRERVAIRDLLQVLDGRALGALMFFFAIPNVLPTPPGTSAVLGAPLIFLAAQLALGLRPWLPALIAERSMPRHEFAALMQRVQPWLARAEKLLQPRLSLLSKAPLRNLVGLVCLLLSLVLVLPVPLGNVLPALAISVMALGVLAHDGLWVVTGMALAGVSVMVISGVIWAALHLLGLLLGL